MPQTTFPEAVHQLAKPISIVLSFVFLGIYWSNHHHMIHHDARKWHRSLWANLHLLFWLSLVPFVTATDGREGFCSPPDRRLRRRAALVRDWVHVLQQLIIRTEGRVKLATAVRRAT